MLKLLQLICLFLVSCLPALVVAADATTLGSAQQAKIQFTRSSGTLAVVKARIEVNGKKVAELAKGESSELFIDPGRTLVKIDSAYSPGQMSFSFSSQAEGEYRFEIIDSVDKMDAEHLFGVPPKVAHGEVLQSSGVLKATLFSAKEKPAKPDVPAVTQPVKVEPAPQAVALGKPVVAEKPAVAPEPVKTSLPVKDQLQELKKLYDQKLISKEIYLEKQKKILESF